MEIDKDRGKKNTMVKRFIVISIMFQMIFYSSLYADGVGGNLTVLSMHTNPANLALREQYPRRLDPEGNFVITPGFEGYYDRELSSRPWGMVDMRFAYGEGYDCADLHAGYVHWGGRWIFPWTGNVQFNIGIGPTLIFRESWTKRFPGLVDDEEGIWTESEDFLVGYQHLWLIGGNLELQYKINPEWMAVYSVIPAVIIVVIHSFGVRYAF